MCLLEKPHPHMHGSNQLLNQISTNANLPHNIHGLMINKGIDATYIMVSFKKQEYPPRHVPFLVVPYGV